VARKEGIGLRQRLRRLWPIAIALPTLGAAPDDGDEAFADARRSLVEHLRARGVASAPVLEAIGRVPRHRLVPDSVRAWAYEDRPLRIGHQQTISQPTVVAIMSDLARIEPGDKVLEVGTGSGYQAAVLAELGATVYSIEIVEPLGRRARRDLDALGYDERVHTRIGDGYRGWPEEAPFDAILVTAAPPEIPAPLREQLAPGARLVVPVGRDIQELIVLEKTPEGFERTESIPVRFVPMTGEAQQ